MDGHVSQPVLCFEYLYCRFIAKEYGVIYRRGFCVDLRFGRPSWICVFFFFFGGLNLENLVGNFLVRIVRLFFVSIDLKLLE